MRRHKMESLFKKIKKKKAKQNFWKPMKIDFGTREYYYAGKQSLRWAARSISQSRLAYTWAYGETLRKTVFSAILVPGGSW